MCRAILSPPVHLQGMVYI